MKSLTPWLCIIATANVSLAFAESGIDAYRQGNFSMAASILSQKDRQSPVANYYLGQMYLYGYGQLKNDNLALRYFKKSAQDGYLKAQNLLARYSLLIKKDPKEALYWFKQAASQNDRAAQMYCAAAYMYGYGVKRNPNMARRYYIAAAKQGSAIAQNTLAEYFLASRNSHNRKLGLIWLDKAVGQGDPKALVLQGELYAQGKHVKKDIVQAKQLFEKAMKAGSIQAIYRMGKMAMNQSDYQSAKKWLSQAAEKNNIQAQMALAQLYLMEKGPFYDPNQGFLLLLKAAQDNNQEAQKQISTLYQEGKGVQKDENIAKEWLEKAKQKRKEITKSPEILAAQWLSNDQGATFAASGYRLKGILADWTNPAALSNNHYNQPPQVTVIKQKEIYQPKFTMVDPNEIAISEYYDALASHLGRLPEDNQLFPKYAVDVANIEFPEPLIPNSPSLSIALQYQDNLPSIEQIRSFHAYDLFTDVNQSKNQPKSKINDLKNKAVLGQSDAQFKLAQLYEAGLGVYQDPDKAIEWYQKAADQGDTQATYNLAVIYLQGKHGKEDYLKGYELLTNAAFKGNLQAQYALARIKELGLKNKQGKQVIQPNIDESMSLYYLASSSDYGLAQHRLAEILVRQKLNDMSVSAKSQRRNLIKTLYQGAVQDGITEASLPLAFFNAMEKIPAKQQEAFKVAKVEAENNNSKAALLLGLLYDRGIGVKKDPHQAVYWYKKSVGNPVSSFILGTYLSEGQAVRQDEEMGKNLLKKSANEGFSYANLNLAIVKKSQKENFLPELDAARALGNSTAGLLLADYYLSMDQNPEQLQQARAIYQNFANKGDKDAQLKLGFMIEQGFGGKTNLKQASYWYQKAAEQGQPMAQLMLGRLLLRGDGDSSPNYAGALKWLNKAKSTIPKAAVTLGFVQETIFDNYIDAQKNYEYAAQHNNKNAEFNLGLLYEMGKGRKVNFEKAKSYYKKAIKQGDRRAMVQLADIYFNGLGGTRSEEKAIQLYKKAAQQGEPEALYMLGLLFETGIGGTNIDYKKAMQYYQKAAQKKNVKARLAIARMYQYGHGVAKNDVKAAELYEALAKDNISYAQVQLAILYYKGIGDKSSPEKGKRLLIKAHANGNQQAKKLMYLLEAKAKEQLSYIEPIASQPTKSIVQQPADGMYLDVLKTSRTEGSA